MQLDVVQDNHATEVGSYFVANYPPFSVWSAEQIPAAMEILDTPPTDGDETPLGLYLHIPFCRKRCHFCYFRVYTDKNSEDIEVYLDALAREISLYADRPRFHGREFEFVYFGGGTPSYLSSEQLERLIDRIREHWSWESAREVTFECEPGTLKKSKLETIKAIGTTRLSLGIEHFDDEVLSINGRAHKSPEIHRAYGWARDVGFRQINIDLIAGMVGETDANWRDTVAKALLLDADSVTIYQMEVPHNTTIAREAKASGTTAPVATWAQKRAWVDYAYGEFERAGYRVSSAYTLVKPSPDAGFVYRDSVWRGADMVGTGVASFSHVNGVHFQNASQWDEYLESLDRGELPLARALPATDHQRLIRELVLQFKLGRIEPAYFRRKFGADILTEFGDALRSLEAERLVTMENGDVRLTRDGLLRVDALLPRFYEGEHRNIRYS